MCELNSEVKMFCTTTNQSDPGDQPLAAKQQQMRQPHRVKQDDPDNTPLHRDVQRLVVWISDDLTAGAVGLARGCPLE